MFKTMALGVIASWSVFAGAQAFDLPRAKQRLMESAVTGESKDPRRTLVAAMMQDRLITHLLGIVTAGSTTLKVDLVLRARRLANQLYFWSNQLRPGADVAAVAALLPDLVDEALDASSLDPDQRRLVRRVVASQMRAARILAAVVGPVTTRIGRGPWRNALRDIMAAQAPEVTKAVYEGMRRRLRCEERLDAGAPVAEAVD